MIINKSQGQTLNQVGLYLPIQVFTHGQLYVAISPIITTEELDFVNVDGETDNQTFIKNIIYNEVFQNVWPRVVEREEVFFLICDFNELSKSTFKIYDS